MSKVELQMNELYKYKVIKNCHDGKVSKSYCEVKLHISRRTVDRLLLLYKEKGKQGFSHSNRERKPATAFDSSLQDKILLLYKNKYLGANFSHFTNILSEDENITVSESFIRSLFRKNNILPPKLGSVRDDAHAKLLDLMNAHPERCAYFGEILQMDASVHLWFGSKKTHLHAAIDDATGNITLF